MKNQFFLFTLTLFFGLSCKIATQQNANADLALSSGQSQVIAEIMEISSARSAEPPCSLEPCLATVRIHKVIHLGNGSEPLNSGKEVKMRFQFTLSKTTKKLFPNLNRAFPGLKERDRFKANIKEEHLIGNQETQWVASDYIIEN